VFNLSYVSQPFCFTQNTATHKILLRLTGITLWVTFSCQRGGKENITFATLNMASMAQRLGEVILPCDGCNVLQCSPLCLASRRLTPIGDKPCHTQWSMAVEVTHGAKSTIVDCTVSRRVDICKYKIADGKDVLQIQDSRWKGCGTRELAKGDQDTNSFPRLKRWYGTS